MPTIPSSNSITMTVNANKSASLSSDYIGNQNDIVTITVNVATSISSSGYDAYVDFTQPDGLSYYKGPYDCSSGTFTFVIGQIDTLMMKDGYLDWQFVLGEDNDLVRTDIWLADLQRTVIKTSVDSVLPTFVPYVPDTIMLDADNVSYNGYAEGDTVTEAIDDVKQDLTNLSFTGSTHDALVTGALIDSEGVDFGVDGLATYLDGRLDKWESRTILNDAQLANKTNIDASFLTLLETGQVTDIKLIGDSITVGAQGGGLADPAGVFIGTTGVREGNKTAPVWANFFRNFITAKYPEITFFNAGIGGWSLTDALSQGVNWYGATNDVVFLMLGTNNRTSTAAAFEANFETVCHNIKATCNHLYVLTAPPSDNDFDDSGVITSPFVITMDIIDTIITKVCVENGYKHISFYRQFLEYREKMQVPFTVLLKEDDSHPIAAGYLLMWQIFQQQIGMITNYHDWKTSIIDTAKMRVVSELASYTDVLSTTPPLSFAANQITYGYISTVHPDKANFPEGAAGNLTTIRGVHNSFIIQTYNIYLTGTLYTRYGYSNNTWSPWKSESDLLSYGLTSASLITAIPIGKISRDIILNANADKANFPEGTGGLLKTVRPSSDYFGYQEYRIYSQNNNIYKRGWTGVAWGAWKRLSGNWSLNSTDRTALSAVGLSKGDEIFDETLNKPVWRDASNTGWVDAAGTAV